MTEALVSQAMTSEVYAALDRLCLLAQAPIKSNVIGTQASALRGRSNDLRDFREYVRGDDLRDIDWNAYARTEALFVRVFSAETALPVHIVIDASTSMHWGEGTTKFVAALRYAAAIAILAAQNSCRVRVTLDHTHYADLNNERQTPDFLKRVDGFVGHENADFPATLTQALDRGHYTIVLSDGYDNEELFRQFKLLSTRNALAFIQLLHRDELSPSVRGEYRLTATEAATSLRLKIDEEAIQAYAKRLERFIGQWRQRCFGIGVRHALVDALEPLEKVMLNELTKAHVVTSRSST